MAWSDLTFFQTKSRTSHPGHMNLVNMSAF